MKKKKSLIRRLLPWLIALLALAALVWFVFVPIYSQEEQDESEAPVIQNYEGDGEALILENDQLLFEMDANTTEFSVTDKATGKVWLSCPADWEQDKIANGTKRESLCSTLNVTYMDSTKEEELNNYTYSILNQNYQISKTEDGGIRVDYTIGKIEKEYMIPSAITKERYDTFKDAMSKKNQKKIKSYYTLYEPDKLDTKENKAEIVALYPSVTEQALYVLKSDTDAAGKAAVEGFFKEANYTQADYEIDSALVAGKRSADVPLFNASMIYHLEGRDLVVEVPYTDLKQKLNYPMTYISILPMFGAAGFDQEGFLFVPEGSGAIINYNNGKLKQSAYYANAYGWDYADSRQEIVSETKTAFCVFGMGQQDGSFICMVDEGSAFCGVSADIAGRYTSYNNVYGKYNVIHVDAYKLDARTAQTTYMFEKSIPDDTVVQRYRFVSGSTYVDMANAYGEYLRELPGMTGHEVGEEMPVNVELVGAIDKMVEKFGMPIKSVVATTTFDEAGTILEDLKASGVENLNIRMTGWCNGGVLQRVLTSVHTVRQIGGDAGMKKLIAKAKEKDVDLTFDGITCFVYDSGIFNGFIPFSNAARFTTREFVKLYPYSIVVYQPADWFDPYYLVKPAYAKKNAENLINALRDKGAAGIAFRDIGNLLSADYYDRDCVSREEVKAMNVEILQQAHDAGLEITIKAGNDYALPYADLITDVDLTGNKYTLLDQMVPFYEVALHGLKEYTGTAINLEGDYQTALLECAEYGAGLNFTFMEEDTTVLADTAYSCYAAAAYERWREQLLPMILRYQTEMKGLNRQSIVGHQSLTNDVKTTTYADGTTVYVNYGDLDYTDGNVTVPARDYLVKGGSGK